MTEDLDYEALFKQVHQENEGLRIKILKLKNDEMTWFESVKEWIVDFISDENNRQLCMLAAFMLFFSVVVPLIRALFRFIFKQKGDLPNEG